VSVKEFTMVLRDLGGIFVGLGLTVQQVLTVKPGDLNEMVLLILALIAGVPGTAQIVSLIRGGSPTDTLSSVPQPLASQPDSPRSSQSV
jgi:hypothetical protein